MHLPKEKILLNSPFRKELEILIKYAEQALTQREPIWTPFLSARLVEEVENKFNNLNDITCIYEGGFPRAERKKICFISSREEHNTTYSDIPIKGIYLKGNFLFDRAKQSDFRNVLHEFDAKEDEIGDIWLIRDRGAQAICSEKCADLLHIKRC